MYLITLFKILILSEETFMFCNLMEILILDNIRESLLQNNHVTVNDCIKNEHFKISYFASSNILMFAPLLGESNMVLSNYERHSY